VAARVVLYDPDRDIAVLYVPGLRRPPLRFDGTMKTGADGVVAGYPENGPLKAVPARVAGEQEVTGPNIYGNKQVTRDVYTLRADVRHGNSGDYLGRSRRRDLRRQRRSTERRLRPHRPGGVIGRSRGRASDQRGFDARVRLIP
jgi:trypsin-like peptidase